MIFKQAHYLGKVEHLLLLFRVERGELDRSVCFVRRILVLLEDVTPQFLVLAHEF